MSSDPNFLFSLLNLDRSSLFQHHNVYCDVCSRSITGIRRKCLTCADIDVCNDCYLRGSHLNHLKIGHNPKSCVFVEIHNQEQTDNFNNWLRDHMGANPPPQQQPPQQQPPQQQPPQQQPPQQQPPQQQPPQQQPFPFFHPPPHYPPPLGQFSIPTSGNPMMPIPTSGNPTRPIFDPLIFPIHPTFPDFQTKWNN